MTPYISVVMSVRNGMPFLPEAVFSVLAQSFEDFEFIVMDNASVDGSNEWVTAQQDKRIRLVRNEEDLGLSQSLNRGFSLARGKYIARMDADDISVPERLAVQAAYMDAHPELVVCGGEVEIFNETSSSLWEVPKGRDAILSTLLFAVPLAHPAVMYRTEAWKSLELQYDRTLLLSQDFDMWRIIGLQMTKALDNMGACVLRYRMHGANLTSVMGDLACREWKEVAKRILTQFMAAAPSQAETDLHFVCAHGCAANAKELASCLAWLMELQNVNMRMGWVAADVFERELLSRWALLCRRTKFKALLLALPLLARGWASGTRRRALALLLQEIACRLRKKLLHT
ncbi:glycosyltransferase family 2 protein [Desulfovibrio falkowii]|uniref:glycosyltransferase family 2 protein n=1 Tax=Desulfovibrio sp. WGS1351 TaxID=3366814 RepID=UPI00372D407F